MSVHRSASDALHPALWPGKFSIKLSHTQKEELGNFERADSWRGIAVETRYFEALTAGP